MRHWRIGGRAGMGGAMESPRKSTLAGGCLIPPAIAAGLAWGAFAHQLSLGFLIGLGAGIVLALLVWAIDRLR
jgi:hypothetical protein